MWFVQLLLNIFIFNVMDWNCLMLDWLIENFLVDVAVLVLVIIIVSNWRQSQIKETKELKGDFYFTVQAVQVLQLVLF